MTSPTFYFAIGRRSSLVDLAVAWAVGQRHFLIPAGASIARELWRIPDVHILYDNGAWPPNNPIRPSRQAYYHEVRSRCGEVRFVGALTYDHLGDQERTDADWIELCCQPWPHHQCPIVPVLQYAQGRGNVAYLLDILADEDTDLWRDMREDDCITWPFSLPACAIGGLVPTCYNQHVTTWYQALLAALDHHTWTLDLPRGRLHLLGIGKPNWVNHRLIGSFDSSGPALLASFGWAKIAPSYRADFGLSVAALRQHRALRLAYWLRHYQAAIGQSWMPLDEHHILSYTLPRESDQRATQLSLFDLAA